MISFFTCSVAFVLAFILVDYDHSLHDVQIFFPFSLVTCPSAHMFIVVIFQMMFVLQDMEGVLSPKGSKLCPKKEKSRNRSDTREFAKVFS